MGIESRARGANYSAGVCVNLARHPAWGRAQESYGEDPLILGSMGTALTLGIRENAMACVKHFALNSMENMRFEVDVKVDEETLHEVYLPHFKQCLEEGGAESLMSSYNSVNGEYVGENKVLLHEMLREDWKMPDVLVTSDFVWGLRDGPKSIKAGLDIEMPWRAVRATSLAKALKRGDLTWEEVKRPGLRIMATQLTFCARMVGTPTPSVDTVGSDQHRALARRVATEGMTLLKNDNDKSGVPLLPLQRKIHKSIAVVGSLADSTQTGDQGSSAVRDNHIISPLAGFKQDHDISTTYMDGSNISNAVQAAESADAVFLLVGYTAKEEGESILCSNVEINRRVLPGWASTLGVHYILKVVGKAFGLFGIDTGGDRKSLRLRSNDEKLIEAIAIAAGHKTILGIEASGAVILPPEARRDCAAILWTGYQGCEFGNALQDVLWGRSEPSGRLPFVIPENEEDLPEWSPYAKNVTYDRWFGYRLLQKRKKKAAYPFGFGLGYGDVRILPGTLRALPLTSRFFTVEVDVENHSLRESSTAVQIYAGRTDAADRSENDYDRVLIGFAKILVNPNERLTVKVACRLNPIAHRNSATKRWELAPGRITIYASRYEGDPDSVNRVVEIASMVIW